jgi:hypothetical protein
MPGSRGETLEDILREIDDMAREHKERLGWEVPAAHVAMMKGWMRAIESPAGRALKSFSNPLNEPAVDKIRTAAGRNAYRERLANTLEFGPVEANRQMVQACSWYGNLPPKMKAEYLRAPKQRELAAAIREELEPVTGGSEALSPRESGSEQLSEVERVRYARAIKLASSQFDLDRFREARTSEDWETFCEIAFQLNFAAVLTLIPPPPGEAFGRRNRSPMLLPTDRRHCQAPGCDKVVPNRATYCPIHARSAVQERDTEKKGKLPPRRKLRKATELAARTADSAVFLGATLPEEYAPTNRNKKRGI